MRPHGGTGFLARELWGSRERHAILVTVLTVRFLAVNPAQSCADPYDDSAGPEARGPETCRRRAELVAFAAASRLAVSLSAASLASRSARRRAVFSASACRAAVLASGSESTLLFVLNCSSARRRPASLGKGWERIGAVSLQVDDLTGQHLLPGISLEPVSSGIFGRRPACRGASDSSP